MSQKRQWMKFYTETWLSDPHVRGLTASDRGILIDVICIARGGAPEGYLINGGKPLSDKDIAGALRLTLRSWKRSRLRLLKSGRISWDKEEKALFVPRVVADAQKSVESARNGRKGGSPRLRRSRMAEKRFDPLDISALQAASDSILSPCSDVHECEFVDQWVKLVEHYGSEQAAITATQALEAQILQTLGTESRDRVREIVTYRLKQGGL